MRVGQPNHRVPQFLPDGRHFLFYVAGGPDVRGVYVGDVDGPKQRRLFDSDTAAVYAASGRLLFARQGTLLPGGVSPNTEWRGIWLLDAKRGVLSRFTAEDNMRPIWSPDGTQIVFAKLGAERVTDLFLKPVGGQPDAGLLLATDQPKAATDWSRDGRLLLYRTADPKRRANVCPTDATKSGSCVRWIVPVNLCHCGHSCGSCDCRRVGSMLGDGCSTPVHLTISRV